MADLQEFIMDITENGVKYCAVCFRTEKNRKLLPGAALREFLKLANLDTLSRTNLLREAPLSRALRTLNAIAEKVDLFCCTLNEFTKSEESACFLCERQAELALKLHRTLQFARDVNRTLWALMERMSPKSVAYLLPSKIRRQTSGPASVKRNKLLSSLRRYQALAQTDVLVVDAHGFDATDNMNEESRDLDAPILINDDDTPTDIPRLVPIEKLLEKPQQNRTEPPTSENDLMGNLILCPLSTANSETQFLIIPQSANINFHDGNTVEVVKNGPTIPLVLPFGSIIPITSPNILLPMNASVSQKWPDANANKATKSPENNHVFVNGNTAGGSDKRERNELCQINEVCQIPDTARGDSMCQISNLRSLKEGGEAGEGKRKPDRHIDWEDKIPMDVISFMDAKDPNAPKLRRNYNNLPHLQINPLQPSFLRNILEDPEIPEQPSVGILEKEGSQIQEHSGSEVINLAGKEEGGRGDDLLVPRRYGRKRKCKVVDDDVICIS